MIHSRHSSLLYRGASTVELSDNGPDPPPCRHLLSPASSRGKGKGVYRQETEINCVSSRQTLHNSLVNQAEQAL